MKKLFLIFIFISNFGLNSDQPRSKSLHYASFKHISFDQILCQKGCDYLVYLYSPTCHYCEVSKQTNLAHLSSFESVYLVNVKEGYVHCQVNVESLCIYGTPTLLKVISNEIVATYIGVKSIEEFFG